jgi:hypothetical protein
MARDDRAVPPATGRTVWPYSILWAALLHQKTMLWD